MKPSENAMTSPCDGSQPVMCKWKDWNPVCQCFGTDRYLTHFSVGLAGYFFVICGLFPMKKNQEYFNEESHPASTCCTLWEWDPCGFLPFFFFLLLYHLLKLLWNICLRLKEFEFSLSLIKVLGLVFTAFAFIKATSSEAFAGATYVLMNNILHFLSQIMVELYFLISWFYLNSKISLLVFCL